MKAVYELPLEAGQQEIILADTTARESIEPQSILAQNVCWFCRLRWIVVSFLVLYGALTFIPALPALFGMRPPGLWPFIIAALLSATNLAFRKYARASGGSERRYTTNLWLQIISDLLLLTVVIHFMGEIHNVAAFAYLFHIVLACIFFDRRQSFIVLALSLALYATLTLLREYGILSSPSVFVEPPQISRVPLFEAAQSLIFASFCAVVWYLTSHLSQIVRQRDLALSELNKSLIEAQEAKARHMLRTTHELKAPFAAIQANVQLLTKGYCGPLSPEAMDTLNRIDQRCRRLANEINEMLQLSNLRSTRPSATPWKTLNVAGVIRWCAAQVQPLATERNVTVDLDLQFCNVRGAEEQLRMLFSNLLSNAILYSFNGGQVRVRCEPGPHGGARVIVADSGIGIEADKLPRIFEEYYRTDRAAQFNTSSSGLGLAIVRHIALTHRIRIRVESEPDHGTVFTLDFPPTNEGQSDRKLSRQEKNHGLYSHRG